MRQRAVRTFAAAAEDRPLFQTKGDFITSGKMQIVFTQFLPYTAPIPEATQAASHPAIDLPMCPGHPDLQLREAPGQVLCDLGRSTFGGIVARVHQSDPRAFASRD